MTIDHRTVTKTHEGFGGWFLEVEGGLMSNPAARSTYYSQAAQEENWNEQSYAREGHPKHPIITENIQVSWKSREIKNKQEVHKLNFTVLVSVYKLEA